jgi:hypothetical protein
MEQIMEYTEYVEKMEPLFVAEDWAGLNAVLESTGPDHYSTINEAKTAFKAYIDTGMKAGVDLDSLDGKLSDLSARILKAVVSASDPIAQILSKILGGGVGMGDMSTHRATKEMCEQCPDEECSTRLAAYRTEPALVQ